MATDAEYDVAPSKKARYESSSHEDSGVPGMPEKRQKPCAKFFSTSGCQFGDSCHYTHFVPGGISHSTHHSSYQHRSHSPPPVKPVSSWQPERPQRPMGFKTKLCSQFYSSEGCRFQDKCHFAHGEAELHRALEDAGGDEGIPGGYGGTYSLGSGAGGYDEEPLPSGVSMSGSRFIIPISMVGSVIGKAGAHVKHVLRMTGAKVAVKEYEQDPGRRCVYVDGAPEETARAMQMVKQFILNRNASAPQPRASGPPSLGAHNYKKRICDKFVVGACTFGSRCHFAHGAGELKEAGAR